MKYELQFTIKHELVFEADNIETAGKVANEHVKRMKGTILSVIPLHVVRREENAVHTEGPTEAA